jgi:hypothetical protein
MIPLAPDLPIVKPIVARAVKSTAFKSDNLLAKLVTKSTAFFKKSLFKKLYLKDSQAVLSEFTLYSNVSVYFANCSSDLPAEFYAVSTNSIVLS